MLVVVVAVAVGCRGSCVFRYGCCFSFSSRFTLHRIFANVSESLCTLAGWCYEWLRYENCLKVLSSFCCCRRRKKTTTFYLFANYTLRLKRYMNQSKTDTAQIYELERTWLLFGCAPCLDCVYVHSATVSDKYVPNATEYNWIFNFDFANGIMKIL